MKEEIIKEDPNDENIKLTKDNSNNTNSYKTIKEEEI